jgi:hypothetical protein
VPCTIISHSLLVDKLIRRIEELHNLLFHLLIISSARVFAQACYLCSYICNVCSLLAVGMQSLLYHVLESVMVSVVMTHRFLNLFQFDC